MFLSNIISNKVNNENAVKFLKIKFLKMFFVLTIIKYSIKNFKLFKDFINKEVLLPAGYLSREASFRFPKSISTVQYSEVNIQKHV